MKYIDRLNMLYHKLLYLNTKTKLPQGMTDFLKLNELDQKIMNILFEQDRYSIYQLNKILNRSKSTMTSALKRLEKKGLISRESSQDDKRVIDILLTARGRELQNCHHAYEKFLFTEILSVFASDQEAKQFLDSFEKVINHFGKKYEEE